MNRSATVGGGLEGQALETKPVSLRVSTGDLIVYAAAVILVLLGWQLKSFHDHRLSAAEVDGITIRFPAGWLRLPVKEPARFAVLADDGTGATLSLYASETTAQQSAEALFFGSPNPAEDQPVYTQLGNQPVAVADRQGLRADYAYVQSQVARPAPPSITRGRQVVWIEDGTLYVLALEAPEQFWDSVSERFDRLIDAIAL